jgi:hypothetical protein
MRGEIDTALRAHPQSPLLLEKALIIATTGKTVVIAVVRGGRFASFSTLVRG